MTTVWILVGVAAWFFLAFIVALVVGFIIAAGSYETSRDWVPDDDREAARGRWDWSEDWAA